MTHCGRKPYAKILILLGKYNCVYPQKYFLTIYFSRLLSYVPALAVGFDDLQKRVEAQKAQATAHQEKLKELKTRINTLANRHSTANAPRLQRAAAVQTQLQQRLVRLVQHLHLLTFSQTWQLSRWRGYEPSKSSNSSNSAEDSWSAEAWTVAVSLFVVENSSVGPG